MSIHHLNCGSMHPYFPPVHGICHCLLVETSDGLVLVDAGFGTRDYTQPTRLMRAFTALLRCPRDLEETAVRQVAGLGYDPQDVRHIVLTHMHLDHTGGLPDFPRARVHVMAEEYEAAMRPKGIKERFYVAAHWAHGPDWVLHTPTGERWFEFDAITAIDGLSPRILMIPLAGHSRGHCGVAVEAPDGWVFHCGDATYPFLDPQPIRLIPGPLERWLIGSHAPRLQAFARQHSDAVQPFFSHIPGLEHFR